jgi:NADP-dependent aldehyde dehydrogenase
MQLTGKNHIGFQLTAHSKKAFKCFSSVTQEELPTRYFEASKAEVDQALKLAERGFKRYKQLPPNDRARLLDQIALEIDNLGETLIKQAQLETGLPESRLVGERSRTTGQLRFFAQHIREGSWVEATIDTANTARHPVPKPDIRSLLGPIGPVVVFSASNFPLAFSVAGGDTASALAAGNSVVVKAHAAHAGTSELVAHAITAAIKKCNLPEGIFSLIHGSSFEPGEQLVLHPSTRAVGFTGSLSGGRALMDLAQKREQPIPVFAEMGSTNPVFILEHALKSKPQALAKQLAGSVTLGVGQFCTKPGLIILMESQEAQVFESAFIDEINAISSAPMLHKGIANSFDNAVTKTLAVSGVAEISRSTDNRDSRQVMGRPILAKVSAETFLDTPLLHEEVFGPYSLVVTCKTQADFERIANALQGQLTVTILGQGHDLANYQSLIEVINEKAGRLIYNGVPTGVEVCNAMHHGGPYPATSDARFTSVGLKAIKRFVKPIAYQNWPDHLLPQELQNANPLKILRLVDDIYTSNSISD